MLKQLKNKQGIVFVTVLVTVIVMMVLTISVISMNVSQVMITESEIQRIKAEMLATGFTSHQYANLILNPASSFTNQSITMDGLTYTVTVLPTGVGTGTYGTNTIGYNITY